MDEKEKKVALKIFFDGKWKEITYEELCLSNNLAQEALVTLLVKKKLIQDNGKHLDNGWMLLQEQLDLIL